MKNSDKNVLEFWEHKGESKSPGRLVTHKDLHQVEMEIKTVLNFLHKNDTLLDVGCGNGFATSIYAKNCLRTIGIDYSSTMVDSATRAYANKRLSFMKANVLDLSKEIGTFSIILSTRCLINLRNWNEQKKAIKKLHELLAPGGRLLLLEGMKQGRDNLNKLRKRTGLSAMPKVWHNIDFDEKKLFPFLKNYFTVKQDIRFGLYDVLTRVYYPAYIFPKDARFRTKHHDTAVKMYYAFGERSCNEYSREACLILIKKETPAVK